MVAIITNWHKASTDLNTHYLFKVTHSTHTVLLSIPVFCGVNKDYQGEERKKPK